MIFLNKKRNAAHVRNVRGVPINIKYGEKMINIKVCIGSSCHIKGSKQVVEGLRELIRVNGLENEVELSGTFCMGKCQQGVCVTVNDEFHSVNPENVGEFFKDVILSKVA